MASAGVSRRAALLALALGVGAGSAHANGRFPQANLLVAGPGARNDVIVLRTTFGIVLSEDLGAHWSWVCEEALDAVGAFDPSVALASDGTVTLGLPFGVRRSTADRCQWPTPPTAPESVVDLTQDAQGAVLFAASARYDEATPYTEVYRSDDRGASWRRTARVDSYIVETIDVAPGDARRVYLSGYRPGAVAALLRSDDGGAMFRATAATFPTLASVFIAAVAPTRPDRLWLRVAAGLGTQLHRSDDGGERTATLATTAEPMDGFAVSDDGRTVWYGTANRAAGIFRARDDGAFTRVAASASVRCMRHHAGVLFVCGDEATDGWSLAWSRDDGEHLNPLVSVRDIAGPLVGCTGDGGVSSVCGPVWAQFAPQLRDLDAAASPPRIPLGVVDAGLDSGLDAGLDAGATDAPSDLPATDLGAHPDAITDQGAPFDAPSPDAPSIDVTDVVLPDGAPLDVATARDAGTSTPPPRSDCDCHVPARGRGSPWALLALLVLARIRRR